MNQILHSKLVYSRWSIADDPIKCVVQEKDIELLYSMVFLRQLDSLHEPSKDVVMEKLAIQRNVA